MGFAADQPLSDLSEIGDRRRLQPRIDTSRTEKLMAELHHECGIAAVYYLGDGALSQFAPPQGGQEASRLIPRLLLDIQNRGQLSAGMTTFNSERRRLIPTPTRKSGRSTGSLPDVLR